MTENVEVLLICLETRQIFTLLSAQLDSKYFFCVKRISVRLDELVFTRNSKH